MANKRKPRSGHATGMAGEFFVMEKLYRLGHQPALTLGNAKSIDILLKKDDGEKREVSVKAICGGGKWGTGSVPPNRPDLVYVLLWYKDFQDPTESPEVFVVPAQAARTLTEPWFRTFAIYCSNQKRRERLEKYRNAWQYI